MAKLKYRKWLGTHATHLLFQCSACGAGSVANAWKTGPAGKGTDPHAHSQRAVRYRCGNCGVQLTAQIPPPGVRPKYPTYCPARMVYTNTLPAVRYPRVKSESSEVYNRVANHTGTYRDYLRSGLLGKDIDHLGPLREGFSGFPVRPVVEQLAYMMKLGLPAVDAILATLASEAHYIMAVPPATMLLENLIGMLTSMVLPPLSRPVPPGWLFDYPVSRATNNVSFPQQRLWYIFARCQKLPDMTLSTRDGLCRMYGSLTDTFSPVRPYIRHCLRPLRVDQYRFPAHTLPRPHGGNLGLFCWEGCHPFVRLDYMRQYHIHRRVAHQLVLH